MPDPLVTDKAREFLAVPAEVVDLKRTAAENAPLFLDLFRGPVRHITILTLLVCGFALTAHWGVPVLVSPASEELAELADWSDAERSRRPLRS